MKLATFPSLPVLLVDDEEQFLLSASFTLSADGINNVTTCHDSRDVMPLLSKQDFSVIALDMNMPHVSGWELLPMIVRDFPDIPVIVITGIGEVETAVECMKSGASDFMLKPVDDARLVTSIGHAIEKREIQSENALLKQYLLSDKLEHPEAFFPIVTESNAMRSIFQYVEAIARTSMPVLITGETGVGKELIAKAIHELSGRVGEFVPVNVAGVDDTLFSDTLFGHERGAFTGADRDRKGLIEQAFGGTMFLDEIGDLALESQVKLPTYQTVQTAGAVVSGLDVPVADDKRLLFPDQLPTLKEAEQTLIEEALRRADGNRTIAAQLPGLSRRALSNRLSRARK